jgi:thiol-disulfide isomerase/thioredoxin
VRLDRHHVLIVALALTSAAAGLALSVWLRPTPPAPTLPANVQPLAIGDRRLDVTLPDRDGRPRRLSEWDGQLVVLNFWASWCGPCREEMPMLDAARRRHAGKGVEIIGVAAEDAAPALAFLRTHPVDYPILIDAPGAGPDLSLRMGNVRSVLPFNVLVGRDGRILAQRIGNMNESTFEAWIAPHLAH